MSNYRMTIINESVYKAKPIVHGRWTDGAGKSVTWVVPAYAKPRFSGSVSECINFIKQSGAQFQPDVVSALKLAA